MRIFLIICLALSFESFAAQPKPVKAVSKAAPKAVPVQGAPTAAICKRPVKGLTKGQLAQIMAAKKAAGCK